MNTFLKIVFFLLAISLITTPLILNYNKIIFFELGDFGDFLTGMAALFAVILTLIEFQFYKSKKVDERVIKAFIVARKFLYSLEYLTSPFSYGTANENEPYPERLTRERNERHDLVKDDFDEFKIISRDADLYLTEEELKIFEDIHKIWLRVNVGFKMHVMFLSQDMAGSRENQKAYADAFLQEGLKIDYERSLEKLDRLIKSLNERYKK